MDKRTKEYKEAAAKAKLEAEKHVVAGESTDNTPEVVETPPVFTPMDTDREPTPVNPLAYEGKVNAIINGDVVQLHIGGDVQVMKLTLFNKIFTLVPPKEVAAPPAERGNWSITIHTPNAVPVQFRKANGTCDTVAMSAWLDSDPKNAKAGIAGCMIGRNMA